ncbi:Fe-only nitrogenase accessory AnfO family protein [Desulfitobacterium chlororespirans]|uniref:Fe-only nitrogenase accessory protein AnfO n=1 Tax=Desulfitobacterium chlororespirans DSM 11544 TaxID=1121395 RepID=A0A1M7TRH1_9FIRM|nr:Fe-only nitrogenase accessory AnfO family protein [Desulfitobacterium chlororespirans]SHN73266.1 Fe-only nitrogenase accessory protein AnfO [Desulfitobacterium chlororespirans DSM 11544]
MKIAVLVNETGVTAGFSEKAELYIYERTGDTWVADQKFDWTPGNHESMAGLRFRLSQMVHWLGDCKVIAAGPTHGFYRVIFEGFGVALWMIEGRPQDFIPQIEHFYCYRQEDRDGTSELIQPIAGKAGYYSVDLRDVMAHNKPLNSREVLIPFFKEAAFARLEITCSHIPKWFEKELPLHKLQMDVETRNNGMKVHVYPV